MTKFYLTNEVIATELWKMLETNPAYSEDLTTKAKPGKSSVCTYFKFRPGVLVTASGDFPDISLAKSGWRTASILKGTFAAGTWTFKIRLKNDTKYGFSVKVAVRLSRSTNADGSNATQIVVSESPNVIALPASAGGSVTDTWTWSASSPITLTNEYLFAEYRIHVEVAGTSSTCQCSFACDENPTTADESIETPTFTPGTCSIDLASRQDNDATTNRGTITFDSVEYSLPNSITKTGGTYTAQYNPASGYVFSSWETSGGVSVSSSTDNPTNVTVTGDGTLRAVYAVFRATSTSSYATSYPFQRKCFYANGRFWVFWSDGSNMVYTTSTDGTSWAGKVTVRAATNGYSFSVWFDGTYLHYAYANTSSIYYRRGTPNADGTITWSADEQTVSTTYNAANYPSIAVDSDGYVWIGYRDSPSATEHYPYVIKSGNNNGTWGTTPTGFPYQLSTSSNPFWRVSVVPLTAGKMLVAYVFSGWYIRVRAWTGSDWLAVANTLSGVDAGEYFSMTSQGDDVHIVLLSSTYDVVYTKYTYSSNSFGTETVLQAGATSSSAPVVSRNPSTNDLYVFWAGYPTANHIYFRKYTASTGAWGTAVDWIAETETLTDNNRLTCFYQAYDSKIGLAYMTNTSSPYNVKFAYLQLVVAVVETIVAKEFPMLYLPKPLKAEMLLSKVEGATITSVANDFPEVLIKKGKAQELRSKFTAS